MKLMHALTILTCAALLLGSAQREQRSHVVLEDRHEAGLYVAGKKSDRRRVIVGVP